MSSVVVSSENVEQPAALSGDLYPLHTAFFNTHAIPFAKIMTRGTLVIFNCLAVLLERDNQLVHLDLSFFGPFFPRTVYSLKILYEVGNAPELVWSDVQRTMLVATCVFQPGQTPRDALTAMADIAVERRHTSHTSHGRLFWGWWCRCRA